MTTTSSIPDMDDKDVILIDLTDNSNDGAEDIMEHFNNHIRDESNSVIRAVEPVKIDFEQHDSNESNSQTENTQAYEYKPKMKKEQGYYYTSLSSSSSSSFITPPSSPTTAVVSSIDNKDPNLFELNSEEIAVNYGSQQGLSAAPSAMVVLPEQVKLEIDQKTLERETLYFDQTTPPHSKEDKPELDGLNRKLTASTSSNSLISKVGEARQWKEGGEEFIEGDSQKLLSFSEGGNRHFSTPDFTDVPPSSTAPFNTLTPSTSSVSFQIENLKINELSPPVCENAVNLSLSKSSEEESPTTQISVPLALASAQLLSITPLSETFASHIPQEFQNLYQKLSTEKQNIYSQFFMRRYCCILNAKKIFSKYQPEKTSELNKNMNERNEETNLMSEANQSNVKNSKGNNQTEKNYKTTLNSPKKNPNLIQRKRIKKVTFNEKVKVIEIGSENSDFGISQQTHEDVASINETDVHNINNTDSPTPNIKINNSLEVPTDREENSMIVPSTSCTNNMVNQPEHKKSHVSLKCKIPIDLKKIDIPNISHADNVARPKLTKSCESAKHKKRNGSTNIDPTLPKRKKQNGLTNSNTTGTLSNNSQYISESESQPSTSEQEHEVSSNKLSESDTKSYEVISQPHDKTIKLKLKKPSKPHIWVKDIKNIQSNQSQEITSNNMNNNHQNNNGTQSNISLTNADQNLSPNPSQIFNESRDFSQMPNSGNLNNIQLNPDRRSKDTSNAFYNNALNLLQMLNRQLDET